MLSVPNVGSAAVGSSHVGTVSPPSGGPGTAFTFAVMYQNAATPTTKNLIIDGTSTVPMSFTKHVGKLDEYIGDHDAGARAAYLQVPIW